MIWFRLGMVAAGVVLQVTPGVHAFGDGWITGLAVIYAIELRKKDAT